MNASRQENVIIIGSGPAGSTAAIYAARANLNPVIICGTQPGGQLTTTTEVENYPGFIHGIDGYTLVSTMQQQAERFSAKYEYRVVEKIEPAKEKKELHKLYLDGGEVWEAKTIIIATGATARYLNLPNEERLKNRGVSACATCDGAFFRDVPIVVVGGGDTAMEEAIFLTRFASKVYLIHRREEFRASKVMIDRVLENPKIEVVYSSVVSDVFGADKVTGVELENLQNKEKSTIECNALFLAIGHVPNTAFLKGTIALDEQGYIITHDETKIDIPGIFVAGDCADHIYRQAIVAAGSGCKAAIDAERYIADTF